MRTEPFPLSRSTESAQTHAGVRIIVTGGAGFIGSHVVTRLVAAGAEVLVIDDLSAGRPENLADAISRGFRKERIHACDVRSEACATLIRRWKPDVVVHLAAQVSTLQSCAAPEIDAAVNITGTINVAEASVRACAQRFVFASSCAIYGQVTPTDLPVSERTPIQPDSPYGLGKATATRYLDWYQRERGLPYTALVLGNVYGPRQVGAAVVARLVSALEADSAPVIVGDGLQTRDFVYVSDVAEAVVSASSRSPVGTVNIGTGVESSIQTVLQVACRATSSVVTAGRAAPTAPEIRRMVLDCRRAASLLGWQAKVDLEEGIAETVRYFRMARVRVA